MTDDTILIEALRKIAEETQGKHRRDRNEYLENVIEWCQETAREALREFEGKHD